MTAQTFSITPNTTTASFRLWGAAVNAAVAACGFVQTADTGQINWTTVNIPSANSAGGYEIWRFSDTLQSTAPIYFKIEYGTNTGSYPQTWMTVGTGSDGAGTITGTVSNIPTPQIAPRQNFMQSSGTPVVTPTTSYVNSGDGSAMAMFLFPNNSPSNWGGGFFLIERTRDGSGAATSDGVVCLYSDYNSTGASCGSCMLTFLPGVKQPIASMSYGSTWPLATSNSAQTAVQTCMVGGTLYPLQVFTGTGPKAGGPSQMVLACCMGDVALGQTVSITHYGTARNFYTAGVGCTASNNGWGVMGLNDLAQIKSFLFRIN